MLEPAEPVAANPGTVNSDGPVDKPNIGIGYTAGTGVVATAPKVSTARGCSCRSVLDPKRPR